MESERGQARNFCLLLQSHAGNKSPTFLSDGSTPGGDNAEQSKIPVGLLLLRFLFLASAPIWRNFARRHRHHPLRSGVWVGKV